MSEVAAGPEHEAKHKLTEWLESHGADVYWEEANKWGHKQFNIRRRADAGGIPDLVILIDGLTLVVEFKPARGAGDVYDATIQLHGYWMEHITAEQDYKVDGRPVEPDGFLTATKYSRFGRLFPPYIDDSPDTLEDFDDSREACFDYGQLPPAEFRMTEQHIRILWRLAKRSEQSLNFDGDTPAIGSLLSEQLQNEKISPRPALLWNRGKTNQDWTVLGE